MSPFDSLDWVEIRQHYDERIQTHKQLLGLHSAKMLDPFARLLLGITNATGNFSASEHGLGPKILGMNPNVLARLDALSSKFRQLTKPRDVPKLIKEAGLSYLAIGVGSEASCMLNPETCWVANTRSIWTHLLIKHADDVATADEALRLYRDADPTGEMYYPIWTEIHRLLETSMTRIAKQGTRLASAAGVNPGSVTFLWADAIANQLYSQHHP